MHSLIASESRPVEFGCPDAEPLCLSRDTGVAAARGALSRSKEGQDDQPVGRGRESLPPLGLDPSPIRGLLFGSFFSALLWAGLYELYRVLA